MEVLSLLDNRESVSKVCLIPNRRYSRPLTGKTCFLHYKLILRLLASSLKIVSSPFLTLDRLTLEESRLLHVWHFDRPDECI
jgi:hypothetical protein